MAHIRPEMTVEECWSHTQPESLVAGDGPYAEALATVLNTMAVSLSRLHFNPDRGADGICLRLLEKVKRAFLVIPDGMSAADVLQCHRFLWEWVEGLSTKGKEHDLAFVFVLPDDASEAFDRALAIGLCLPLDDLIAHGHAIWRRSGTLSELLQLVACIQEADLVSIKARRDNDNRRLSLKRLATAIHQDDRTVIRGAARGVLDAFGASVYYLDLFCRPPSHRHGNLLREWLVAAVTGPVTQDWWDTARNQLPLWLADSGEKGAP